jgi:hypothetical protein
MQITYKKGLTPSELVMFVVSAIITAAFIITFINLTSSYSVSSLKSADVNFLKSLANAMDEQCRQIIPGSKLGENSSPPILKEIGFSKFFEKLEFFKESGKAYFNITWKDDKKERIDFLECENFKAVGDITLDKLKPEKNYNVYFRAGYSEKKEKTVEAKFEEVKQNERK